MVLLGVLLGAPPTSEDSGPTPLISNGIDASTCQWPSVVAMIDIEQGGLPFCSGTLLTPDVVMFAAHCIHEENSGWTAGAVAFGEDAYAPERLVPVADCVTHPDYDPDSQWLDLAYCRLAEAVTDVPIVPMLMGCEVGVVDPGDPVAIVGFGASSAIYDGVGLDIQGVGRKRFTKMTVEEIDYVDNDLRILGDDTGACFGDSGGPAFAQLPDGQWRVIGAASTLHPETPYVDGDDVCTFGTIYELGYTQAAWIEGSSGTDVTPCHDPNGQWNPGPRCTDFALEPWLGEGSWSEGCPNGGTTGWVSTCGPAYPDESEPPTPPDLPPPMEPDPMPPPPPVDPDPVPPDDGGTGEDPGLAESTTPGRGCGCGTAPGVPAAWVLILLPLWRRRAS